MSKFALKEETVEVKDTVGNVHKVKVRELNQGERTAFAEKSQQEERLRLPSLICSMGVIDKEFAQTVDEWDSEPPAVVSILMRKIMELSNMGIDKKPEKEEEAAKQPDA